MKHCLVVDDSRVVRKVACRILESLNFETEEAEDGEGAVEACKTRMPDVILLDDTLPTLSGAELVRRIRGQRNGEHPFIIVCTTENDVKHVVAMLNAGASEFLLKPFDREAVIAKFADIGVAVA